MNTINAIAKVRFATAKPQHVQLGRNGELAVELICLEAGQSLEIRSGQWSYYVVAGSANVTANGQASRIGPGEVAMGEADERHVLANAGEGRLILLATGTHQ